MIVVNGETIRIFFIFLLTIIWIMLLTDTALRSLPDEDE